MGEYLREGVCMVSARGMGVLGMGEYVGDERGGGYGSGEIWAVVSPVTLLY